MKRVTAILDTDTYNEVDDQFALAHLLLHDETIDLQAVHAAPFFNSRSSGPGDGMEKSYEEIQRMLELVGPKVPPAVYRGSTSYLPDARTPVESEAVRDLIERALAAKETLYVLTIGACTNVASALLLEPRIAEKIQIVWLGGHAPHWENTREFNLAQDPHATRILLDGPAPLVLVPCIPVASHLKTTVAELEKELAPFSRLGAYLTDIVSDYGGNRLGWSKVIWDIAVSGWLIERKWVRTLSMPSPVLRDDITWEQPTPATRRQIDVAVQVDRDSIFADFFTRARNSGS